MKSLAILAIGTLAVAAQEAPDPNVHGDPYVPVGTLEVNPIFVQTGVKPNLDWGIEFPTIFSDLAIVGNTGSLVTTQEVTTEVRVDGASFNCGSEQQTEREVALWIRVGGDGSNWSLIFYGDKTEVNPSKVLYRQTIAAGTKIDVAARGKSPSGSWYPIVWTVDGSQQLVYLANDETVPDYIIPKFSTQELQSYTTVLLSDDNLTAEIGPKDLIYMFELSSTDPEEECFDLQDIVVTIQFSTKNNNGHGNNIDGVDVSNPAGDTGPAGIADTDGTVDDEMKSGTVTVTVK